MLTKIGLKTGFVLELPPQPLVDLNIAKYTKKKDWYIVKAMKELFLSPKILGGIILVLVLIVGFVSYKLYSEKADPMKDPQNEASQLVLAVGKIADLPSEPPTIATVTDKSKLSQYPFFSKAEIGDKVLLFNNAKKAYLYRPSSGKLIEVGPIAVSNALEASNSALPNEATPEARKKSSVTVLNGTKTAGLATKVQTKLESAVKDIEITQKGNAKNDYPKTVIFLKNTESKLAADQIAAELKATVENLPEGEADPKTDIVIFVGNDQV